MPEGREGGVPLKEKEENEEKGRVEILDKENSLPDYMQRVLDAEIKSYRELEATGNILEDLKKLASIKGTRLDDYIYDSFTGSYEADPDDPEAVYNYFISEGLDMDKDYGDKVVNEHSKALKRILEAYKDKRE